MELNDDKTSRLRKIFDTFDENGIEYVVLRKYEGLPHEGTDDIDIQAKASDFEQAVELGRSHSFEVAHSTSRELIDLMIYALTHPKKVLFLMGNYPSAIARELISTTKPYSSGSYGYKTIKLDYQDIRLDFKKYLAYRSPMNGNRIRVDPVVEAKMFERRQEYNGFYIPSPPDELAHIVCHCLYDKEGNFTTYYQNKCDELFKLVTTDEEYDQQFKSLLRHLFFEADEFVYEQISSGNYSTMLDELFAFDNY